MHAFGRNLYSATEDRGNDIFVGQHGVELTQKGDIITFDNESKTKKPSAALIFSQPVLANEKEKVLYGFSCKRDSLNEGKTVRSGSAEMLANGNILIGMGGLGRVSEQRLADSVVVWDMICTHFDTTQKKMGPLPNYRNHFVESMYPYLFKAVEKGKQQITIFNRGEKADSYEIKSLKIESKLIWLP